MSADFDVDEHLKEFANELKNAGCSLEEVGSALRDQSETAKDQNWDAVAKNEELSSFVEIYIVVMSVVAYALKTKKLSYKPSKNFIKALTIKILTKLPKENDKPLLTKWEYMNNLHHVFHEIHQDIDPSPIIPIDAEEDAETPLKSGRKTSKSIEPNLASHVAITTTTNICTTWEVGTICRVTNFEKDGVDYSGNTCSIKHKYDEDFHGYFVQFDVDFRETYVTADKLEIIDGTASGDSESGVSLNSTKTYTAVSTGNDDYTNNTGINDIKERFVDCCDNAWTYANDHRNNVCCWIILLVLVIVASWIIHQGNVKVTDAKEYEESSTEEKCLILSYERDECQFDCGNNGCDSYQSKYGDNVYKCVDDSGEDNCYGYDYRYTATVAEKCGGTELYGNDYDVQLSCNGESPYEVGIEVDCYVLACSEQEFTIHHFSAFKTLGIAYIVGGSIFISYVFCFGCGYAFYKYRDSGYEY